MKIKNRTPSKFLNNSIIKPTNYTKDSVEIIRQLKISIKKRIDLFENDSYDDSTQITLDTIIYSPDFKKIAVFVMLKTPSHRQLTPDLKYDWYYDSTGYLGLRKNNTIELTWIGPSFTNSYDKKELSNIMRDYYFTNFVRKDLGYKYNMNDIRFWDDIIWKKTMNKKN